MPQELTFPNRTGIYEAPRYLGNAQDIRRNDLRLLP